MKTQINEQKVNEVNNIIKNNKLLKDRFKALENAGFSIYEKAMGNGGTGQIKKNMMQVGSGKGRYNYAPIVYIN
jgi:hypothetical protein